LTRVHFTGLLVIYYPSITKLTLFISVTRVRNFGYLVIKSFVSENCLN